METYELVLRTSFAATHQLAMPDGVTEPLHSHDWGVEVFLEGGRLGKSDIVADFAALRRGLAAVVDELRDRNLNDLSVFAGRNPSTELVAKHIYGRFATAIPPEVRMTKVRVWETPDCAAAYVPESGQRLQP